MSKNDLATDGAGSPPVTEGNVGNREFDNISLDSGFDAMKASLERQGVRTDHVEVRRIEEPELTADDFYTNDYKESNEFRGEVEEQEADQVEELDTDDNSDETHIEDADAEVEGDEEVDPGDDVNENAEIDVLAYDDLFDQVQKIEIGGEVYTPAQLKSILGQEVSAGTRAREAAERTKELDAREQQLEAQIQWLDTRKVAAVQSDEMARIARDYQALEDAHMELDPEVDLYEVNLNREKMNRMGKRYQQLKQEVDAVTARVEAEKEQRSAAVLKEKGYDYLLSNNKRSQAWNDYAQNNLGMSEAAVFQAVTDPSVVIAIEKARRWDEAQSKDTTKLTSSSKTPRSTGRLKQPSQRAKAQKQAAHIKR